MNKNWEKKEPTFSATEDFADQNDDLSRDSEQGQRQDYTSYRPGQEDFSAQDQPTPTRRQTGIQDDTDSGEDRFTPTDDYADQEFEQQEPPPEEGGVRASDGLGRAYIPNSPHNVPDEDLQPDGHGAAGGPGGPSGPGGPGGTGGSGGQEPPRKKGAKRWLTMLSIKIGIVAAVVFGVMFLYFSSVVYSEYDTVDDKWVLPAVVYSRALELYPDQRLSIEQMVYELKLLKYRQSSNPTKSGEYAVNYKTGRIVVIRRPFTFPDGKEERMTFMIEFADKRVSRILNADTRQELSYVRMDPVLLDRINRIDPKEDRIFISLAEVPKMLITTLLEIEDRSYYSHMGVNFMAIGRAFVKNLMAGRVVEGGSTITQQLVKNYFLSSQKSYARKLKEIIMAIIMDQRYTKNQILEAYMNEIYLGQNGNAGIYGFGLASYFYFGIPVSELSIDQMALLVGLIKGPSYYDPWRREENAIERRNTVLAVLRNRGHLTEAEYEQYSSRPVGVIRRGSMNYSKTPAFMGLLKMEIAERFGDEFLSGNGIRIFSSLDPQSQAAAEKAVASELDAIEKRSGRKGLEAAMVVSSWRTAEVAAVVGSRTPQYEGFNRVIEGRRQIGSLAKPFVYHTAFSRGYHLGNIVTDEPITVRLSDGKLWSPKNDDNRFRGPIKVIRAMSRSLNVPTVKIGMNVGLKQVVNTFKAVGLKKDLPLYPSILLGSMELTPYELNAIYAGLATEGVYTSLTTLRTIVKDGEVVYERGNTRQPKSLDSRDVYLTIYGMTEATRTGTGRRLGNMFPKINIASKTGTTNDNRDTWSTGMDSEELVTTWVGYDDNKSTNLYGASGALMVYAAYLKERGVNSLELKRPAGVKFVNFNTSGQVVADGCSMPGLSLLPSREDYIQEIVPCGAEGLENVAAVNLPDAQEAALLQSAQPAQQQVPQSSTPGFGVVVPASSPEGSAAAVGAAQGQGSGSGSSSQSSAADEMERALLGL